MPEIEGPNVVQPEDVIGVAMRDEHRVYFFNPRAQSLLPEICRNIHQQLLARVFDQQARAQPLIARISGTARRAMTANHRHANRSPSSEKGELHCSWKSEAWARIVLAFKQKEFHHEGTKRTKEVTEMQSVVTGFLFFFPSFSSLLRGFIFLKSIAARVPQPAA